MQALFSGYGRGYEWECNLVESQAVGVESGKELELTTRQEALYLCLWLARAAQIHARGGGARIHFNTLPSRPRRGPNSIRESPPRMKIPNALLELGVRIPRDSRCPPRIDVTRLPEIPSYFVLYLPRSDPTQCVI